MKKSLDRLEAAIAGRYTIERELGAGGMATVYLAEDSKHDRKVALKVLRPELAAVLGAERFIHEIKTTASLQHPHILPLFDSGGADSFLYYVMPFIDGETLRDKLNRETQLGIEEAVKITTEVADALDYAHRNNVIHRDIKPENILLHDGRPMVADFGIALAVSAAAGGRMTETGLSLGTPHYMSPEQATAEKDLTNRSDIYSLGAVLYEMLTGDPPHTGSTAQQIVMKIVTEDPAPVTNMRKSVPPNVAAATAMALEKLPADRFDSAANFAEALASPWFTAPNLPIAVRATAVQGPWKRMSVALGLFAAVMTIVAVGLFLRSEPPQAVVRYRVYEAEGEGRMGSVAISPDGRDLVYQGPGPRGGQLWRRSRDELNGAPIPGTQSAFRPFFSSDGASVGFFTVNPASLQIMPLNGGPASTLATAGQFNPGGGASWGSDGLVYYSGYGGEPLVNRGIHRVAATGGASQRVTVPDAARNETAHLWPDKLPSGNGLLFTAAYGPDPNLYDIAVAQAGTEQHRVLTRGVYARYAASGHILVITADGTLSAAPFDESSLEMSGDPVALAADVLVRVTSPNTVQNFGAMLRISRTGTLLYASDRGALGVDASKRKLTWVYRDGREEDAFPDWRAQFATLAISPDGSRVVTAVRDGRQWDLWIRQFQDGAAFKLTHEMRSNRRPAWSPDGRWVTFVGYDDEPTATLFTKRADGTGGLRQEIDHATPVFEGLWSPDRNWLVYRTDNNDPNRGDILAYRSDWDSTVALIATEFEEHSPALSPDGEWLAYVSDHEGKPEVFVSPFPNTNSGIWRISTDGGMQPLWAHSGRELFYQNEKGEMVAVPIQTEPNVVIGEERALFSTSGYLRPVATSIGTFNHAAYAVAPGDERFLMIKVPDGAEGELIAVEHFFTELREKVGR
ncbi:MAG: protein kinase [Gemmatimonadota bacterium]|nr:MAG: protein kinase [Gemmatimonadota bacterium]